MSGLKERAGFNDNGVADREYKLPSNGLHVIEGTEGVTIWENETDTGTIKKINIPFICSKGDREEGMKFSIQVWIDGNYPETAANVITAIVVATKTDDDFLAGFAKKERVERRGYPITEENIEKVVSSDVAQDTVNALNVLLPGKPFGVKLAISKGEYPKVSFTKYVIAGTNGFEEIFGNGKVGEVSSAPVKTAVVTEEDTDMPF